MNIKFDSRVCLEMDLKYERFNSGQFYRYRITMKQQENQALQAVKTKSSKNKKRVHILFSFFVTISMSYAKTEKVQKSFLIVSVINLAACINLHQLAQL